MRPDLLSVWPVAQLSPRAQRAGRYLPISGTHPAKMLPAIAARAIATYTAPGDLVLDPMCGIGTTLVEAMHLGRDAAGVEYEPQWAEHAHANVQLARAQGAGGRGEIVCADARQLITVLDQALQGLVALVLTSPPYGASLHGQVSARTGGGIEKSHFRYSTDRSNLAHVSLDQLLAGFTTILADCAILLRPGGVVAITTRPWRSRGHLVDLPGAVLRCGQAAGLIPVERNVALLAGLRDDQLIPRASFFALNQVRRSRQHGGRQLVIAHEDLLILRKSSVRRPAAARLAAPARKPTS